jgi:hypothetical protein
LLLSLADETVVLYGSGLFRIGETLPLRSLL